MILELETVVDIGVHLLSSMAAKSGSRQATVKCGLELPFEQFDEHGPWTGWASEVTCAACLAAMAAKEPTR